MTPSGRRSDRVERRMPATPENGALPAINAPETLSLAAVSVRPQSERARRVRRTGERQLRDLEPELSDRDWAVIRSFEQHPFLTTVQLQALHFASHATLDAASRVARRVLHRLSNLRVVEPLERRVGGVRAGSASYVWRLGPVGDRLLQQDGGAGIRKRRKEPSAYFLAHQLAIAEAHLALVAASRAGQFELIEVQTEPRCWRPYVGSHGGTDILKPDLFAATASGAYEDRWFVEIDRGTESIPTLIRKCAQYETYRRGGREQQANDVFPLVVWQLPTETRINKLAQALRSARSLDSELFRLTTPERLIEALTGAPDKQPLKGGDHA